MRLDVRRMPKQYNLTHKFRTDSDGQGLKHEVLLNYGHSIMVISDTDNSVIVGVDDDGNFHYAAQGVPVHFHYTTDPSDGSDTSVLEITLDGEIQDVTFGLYRP